MIPPYQQLEQPDSPYSYVLSCLISWAHYRYPLSVLDIARDTSHFHPTQKPVALMEYLIRTYTNPGETVLDFTMGSGTTGVAAIKAGRKFIGIELDPSYFRIACQRIKEVELVNP